MFWFWPQDEIQLQQAESRSETKHTDTQTKGTPSVQDCYFVLQGALLPHPLSHTHNHTLAKTHSEVESQQCNVVWAANSPFIVSDFSKWRSRSKSGFNLLLKCLCRNVRKEKKKRSPFSFQTIQRFKTSKSDGGTASRQQYQWIVCIS